MDLCCVGSIFKASVDYIRKLQRDANKQRMSEGRQKQMFESIRLMKLRIQELEVMARAHGYSTPALMPDTKPLAEAAEHALGNITPRSVTPGTPYLTPQRSARETPVDLTELVRNSPSIDIKGASPHVDLSKLNLEPQDTLTEENVGDEPQSLDDTSEQNHQPMDS